MTPGVPSSQRGNAPPVIGSGFDQVSGVAGCLLAVLREHGHPTPDVPINETDIASIRAAFDDGEWAEAAELRRLFPGVTDMNKARYWARTIVGWQSIKAAAPAHAAEAASIQAGTT